MLVKLTLSAIDLSEIPTAMFLMIGAIILSKMATDVNTAIDENKPNVMYIPF